MVDAARYHRFESTKREWAKLNGTHANTAPMIRHKGGLRSDLNLLLRLALGRPAVNFPFEKGRSWRAVKRLKRNGKLIKEAVSHKNLI